MGSKQSFLTFAALVLLALCADVHSQTGGTAMSIEKHAQLTQAGAMQIRIRITCGPFEGVEEFQQGFVGGSQEKTGAESESGIDGMVTCDGVQRTHTARMTSFGPAFKRGPAQANASLILCMLDGDEQMCFSGSAARRVIIRGPAIP